MGMEELKQKLINVCNESNLPIEAIVFVVKDVWRDAEDTLRQYKAAQEQASPQLQQKEENEK